VKLLEKDCLAAYSVAKLLGVEMEPWQERLVQAMFMLHREESADPKTIVESPICEHVYFPGPGKTPRPCVIAAGHGGYHQMKDGIKFR
jgi:hypothetical protein